MQHRSLTFLAAAALLSACAAPQPPTAGPARPAGGHGIDAFLGSYDADRDGRVTRAEYDAIRLQRFRAADTNGDGVLSEAEYVAEFEGRLKRQYLDQGREPDAAYDNSLRQAHVRFALVNRARDGRYTPAEDRAAATRTFERLDTSRDGVVSRDDPAPPPAQPGRADAAD